MKQDYYVMLRELIALQKTERAKLRIIKKIKDAIKTKRGNSHDWKFTSVHHGWTFWYSCKLCGKNNGEDRELTKENKKEKCSFFDDNFIPDVNNLKEYLKYWRK